MKYRVIQWTTGNVGRPALEAIIKHPELDLVGCFVTSPDKIGRDAGELAGTGLTGVIATNDVDALLALNPDCVVYAPKFMDVDEMIRILESGANIVSVAYFITGHWLGKDRDRLIAACERGRSSIFGSGSNPGYTEMMTRSATSLCDRIDKVTMTQMADCTGYDSPEGELPLGFGQPLDNPELPGMIRKHTAYFEDRLWMLAEAFGITYDEVTVEVEYATTTEDLDLGSWKIEAGCVAGIDYRWQGRIGGRVIVELRSRLTKGYTLDPPWELDRGWHIEIQGRPTVKMHIATEPPPDFEATTVNDYMVISMIGTAMPAVNAIPHVVAARPGVVTYNDIPVPTPRGLVSA
jgi:hypothetical protein